MNVSKLAQSEIGLCIVINDKSQGSITKHLSWDGLLYDKFITQFANERIFEIGKYLAKVKSKMVECVICPIRLTILKTQKFAK